MSGQNARQAKVDRNFCGWVGRQGYRHNINSRLETQRKPCLCHQRCHNLSNYARVFATPASVKRRSFIWHPAFLWAWQHFANTAASLQPLSASRYFLCRLLGMSGIDMTRS